jgi:peptidoglycan/LPS O-acetylase OafA/YrhL
MAEGRETIGGAFESRPNALNFLRLCLALEVVVWHAYALRAGTWLPGWVERLLGDIAVDSFFAISGFLITRAWLRRPHVGRFLLARARRLLPGLWVCLIITAFVIAPLAARWSGSSAPSMSEQWSYLWQNALTRYAHPGIEGTPRGIPVAGAWNGSLWSLRFEADCYLLVLVGGLFGLFRARVVVAGGTLALCALTAMGSDELAPLLFRTLLMFGCGATLYLFADLVPRSRLIAGVSSALLAGSA